MVPWGPTRSTVFLAQKPHSLKYASLRGMPRPFTESGIWGTSLPFCPRVTVSMSSLAFLTRTTCGQPTLRPKRAPTHRSLFLKTRKWCASSPTKSCSPLDSPIESFRSFVKAMRQTCLFSRIWRTQCPTCLCLFPKPEMVKAAMAFWGM